ncbi:PREDICTED: striated muscle-specific serine/threonine-protein kinase-like, partial [Nestor notabilis]|uniref:striated muscle-specific serine/threonine-protein kinase-like n=1 Tax=Nestor notabilis TaxID=176057 RepID=UPI000523C754
MNTTPTSVLALSQAEERSSWSGSQQTVVEKETDARLCAQGPYLRPAAWLKPQGTPRQANTPAPCSAEVRHLGVEPLVRASRANLVGTSWGSEDSLSVASDPYGSAFSLYRGRALSLHVSIPQGGYRRDDPHSGSVSPKPGAEAPWSPAAPPLTAKPPLIRSPSPPLPPPTSATSQPAARGPGIPSSTPVTPRKKSSVPVEYQDTVPEEYEEKIKKPKSSGYSQGSTQESRPQTPMSDTSGRISVRKAASFDERGKFASRIYAIEHKFAEELTRIKWTVSKQQLRRSQELCKAGVALVGPDGEPDLGGQRGRKAPARGRVVAKSSDDSYVSAGEDPLEAPIFEIPIQDMAVAVGAEVLLKCIVTANPQPE